VSRGRSRAVSARAGAGRTPRAAGASAPAEPQLEPVATRRPPLPLRASPPRLEHDADTIVLGSGIGGLAIAALLAADGERVLVLEAHTRPGGHAHTFRVGEFRFCSQVHAVFEAGEGETIDRFLRTIGAADVRFQRLDPEGFDHVVVGDERFRVPNGLAKHRDRLLRRFPAERPGIFRYFALLAAVRDEIAQRSDDAPYEALAATPKLVGERRATLGDVFDRLALTPLARALLAGPANGHLLPPSRVSFLAHALSTTGYDDGAYYPEHHLAHFVDAIAAAIAARGGRLRLGAKVAAIDAVGDRVVGVRTAGGAVLRAGRYVSNIDPRRTAALLGARSAGELLASTLRYDYSTGVFGLHLGLRGIDLREHGFGAFRVWHYPHPDLDAIHARHDRGDLDDPWFLLSTPTLHGAAGELAPPDAQILQVATSAGYAAFASLEAESAESGRARERAVGERLLDVIEDRYVPRLREHVAVRVAVAPTTTERVCGAPAGNALGPILTPPHALRRVPAETPLENLFLCGASTGWPSVSGAIDAAARLHRSLRMARA